MLFVPNWDFVVEPPNTEKLEPRPNRIWIPYTLATPTRAIMPLVGGTCQTQTPIRRDQRRRHDNNPLKDMQNGLIILDLGLDDSCPL